MCTLTGGLRYGCRRGRGSRGIGVTSWRGQPRQRPGGWSPSPPGAETAWRGWHGAARLLGPWSGDHETSHWGCWRTGASCGGCADCRRPFLASPAWPRVLDGRQPPLSDFGDCIFGLVPVWSEAARGAWPRRTVPHSDPSLTSRRLGASSRGQRGQSCWPRQWDSLGLIWRNCDDPHSTRTGVCRLSCLEFGTRKCSRHSENGNISIKQGIEPH